MSHVEIINNHELVLSMNKKSMLEDHLRNHGYQLTRARMLLLDFFSENIGHYTAEDIYVHLKDYEVAIATVYRNLEVLEKIKVVQKTYIDGKHYYELCMYSQKRTHIHIHCKICHQILECKDPEVVSNLLQQKAFIEKKYPYSIDDIAVVMQGICQQCSRRKYQDRGKDDQ